MNIYSIEIEEVGIRKLQLDFIHSEQGIIRKVADILEKDTHY